MTRYYDTQAAVEFIASANTRETSREVMEAIAFFARSTEEADALWNGDSIGKIANLSDIWENATNNGSRDDEELFWGGRTLREVMDENA